MKKIITFFLLWWFTILAQAAGFTDIKFGQYQIADTQWNVSACLYTNTCQIYSKNPGVAYKIPWYNGQVSWASGDYVRFLPNLDNNGQQNTTNPWTAVQFNSNNSQKSILGNGHIVNMGSGYFFFVGYDNNTGQLFSGTTGMSGTAGVTWTGTLNPTVAQTDTYASNYSTAPLASGTTYTPPPAYVSSITTQQQANVNSAINLRNTITQNSIYIDQVGEHNQISVTQDGRYNMVTGTGSTSMPVQGDYNTITIRQGDPANTTGKNLIQASVYGSYNNLNLNQGRDQYGGYTGADVGGHMQFITISGNSNSVITQQQNSGAYTNNYLETNITGNNNTQNITQLGNATKQVFVTTNGNGNTLNTYQDGLGNHYLNVNMTGTGNDAQVVQTGNTANAATINLINSGAPASVNLTQTGGQTYNITQSCTTACGTVTVRQ